MSRVQIRQFQIKFLTLRHATQLYENLPQGYSSNFNSPFYNMFDVRLHDAMSWNCPETSDSAGQELQNLIEIYHLNQQPFIDRISQDLTILIEVLSLS